jgi:MiaB-like tRNA modifying enzyme
MISNLKDYIVVNSESEANIVVINSCTVTNSADSTLKSYINKIKREYPNIKIHLTGCASFTKGKNLLESNKIDGVFTPSEKESINSLLTQKNYFKIGSLNHIDKTVVSDFVGRSRAFIKIQEGCNFRCSYCIIPFVRGDARSYDKSVILNQISKLASNGFGEFVLTGTNMGSYGVDTGTSLAKLLKEISYIKGVKRVRLGSIEPSQITDEFRELLDESWMGKHLHIALQHTSKEMLKIMNRRNRPLRDLELFESIASKGYAIGTDFIVGHPYENSTNWAEAVENFKKFPITHIHLFTYSKRDNTPSASMKNLVPKEIAKARYKEIETIVNQNSFNFRKNIKPLNILVEEYKDGFYYGFDQYFNKIKIDSEDDILSNWITVDSYKALEDGVNFAKITRG